MFRFSSGIERGRKRLRKAHYQLCFSRHITFVLVDFTFYLILVLTNEKYSMQLKLNVIVTYRGKEFSLLVQRGSKQVFFYQNN